jgi:hypothetical protein
MNAHIAQQANGANSHPAATMKVKMHEKFMKISLMKKYRLQQRNQL